MRRVGGGEPDVRLRIGRLVVDADAGAVDREALVAALERALTARVSGESPSMGPAGVDLPRSATEALVHAVTARVNPLIGARAAGGPRSGVVDRSSPAGVERAGHARPVTGGSARE